MSYKSTILKSIECKDAKSPKAVEEADKAIAITDKAIAKAKQDKAQREKALRPDQITDGVKAVAEKVAEFGTSRFTAREIGQMIGYTEAFVAEVIEAMEAE
jgi:hypothetical protein